MAQVGGQIDIHIADIIGIGLRPGGLQRQAETALATLI